MGFSGTAWGNHAGSPARYADSVVFFAVTNSSAAIAPHGTSGDSTGVEKNALGQEDGNCCVGYVTLGTGTTVATGSITVRFDDNVLIPDGTSSDDLTVWETYGIFPYSVDLAEIFVSADGAFWVSLGSAVNGSTGGPFANSYDVDPTGLPFVRYVRILNDGNPALDPGGKGFDVDAVEALNSVSDSIADSCGDGGNDGRDIEDLRVTSDGTNIVVTLELCGVSRDDTKYRVHFDYTGPLATDPDLRDPGTCVLDVSIDPLNDLEGTTSDDTMTMRGNRDTGPGVITGGSVIFTYTVSYAELGLSSGDLVLVWADTQWHGIVDRAPDTNGTDGCSKPTGVDEVIGTVLD